MTLCCTKQIGCIFKVTITKRKPTRCREAHPGALVQTGGEMILCAGPVELVVEGGGGVVLEGEETLEVALVVVQGRRSVQRGLEVENPARDPLPSKKLNCKIKIVV